MDGDHLNTLFNTESANENDFLPKISNLAVLAVLPDFGSLKANLLLFFTYIYRIAEFKAARYGKIGNTKYNR